MKFYITEETKQEIEAIIEQLQHTEALRSFTIGVLLAEEAFYKRVLESAIILPVEESWEETCCELPFYIKQQLENNSPTGVIIQPKQ
jgi:hypothetical protein